MIRRSLFVCQNVFIHLLDWSRKLNNVVCNLMWDNLILVLTMFMAFPFQVINVITRMIEASIRAEDSIVLGWQASPDKVRSIIISHLGFVSFYTGCLVQVGKDSL